MEFRRANRDLLVSPAHGGGPQAPDLGVSAHPLRFLDYRIESPAQAVVLAGSGILVSVPDPARFAIHKLWISNRRPVSEQTKALKDLRQAGNLLDVLLEDRPGDILTAWDTLSRHPAPLKTVISAIRKLPAELQARLASLLPLAG